nr:hypothetical protein [Erwinia sp. Ejp617]
MMAVRVSVSAFLALWLQAMGVFAADIVPGIAGALVWRRAVAAE